MTSLKQTQPGSDVNRFCGKLSARKFLALLSIFLCFLIASFTVLGADESRIYQCSTSEDVIKALETVRAGDTIMLQGGEVYEIDESFRLNAKGSEAHKISFSSEDASGQGRYAVISTVGQKKAERLPAIMLTGSFWNVSRLEIGGSRIPLGLGYWDTNGFLIGIYLRGSGSHHNVIEDVHIHHTHNTAVAPFRSATPGCGARFRSPRNAKTW